MADHGAVQTEARAVRSHRRFELLLGIPGLPLAHRPSLMQNQAMTPFAFVCPQCRGSLAPAAGSSPATGSYHCPADGLTYSCLDGIWRFLPPEMARHYTQFSNEYETVRRAEGWGSPHSTYYRALPFADLSGRFGEIWRIRSITYRALLRHVVVPLTRSVSRPLRLLDLGAGNGWLSYRLSQHGHQVAAVDLLVNEWDGLGARRHYDVSFTAVQASFDHLPFAAGQADLIVFNGSLHYSSNTHRTLEHALSLLRRGGELVVMDSPVYHDAGSGRQMVQEREAAFSEAHGFRGNSLANENFFTFDGMAKLGRSLGIRWRLVRPFFGWRGTLRPWLARLRRRREPASFPLFAGKREV
jgi:SAM-dependent methyltransferase